MSLARDLRGVFRRMRRRWAALGEWIGARSTDRARTGSGPGWAAGSLRWAALALAVLITGYAMLARLARTTRIGRDPAVPVLFRVSLGKRGAMLPRGGSGRYFMLRPEGGRGGAVRWVASEPGRGVRAYRSGDAIPVFGSSQRVLDLFPMPCDDRAKKRDQSRLLSTAASAPAPRPKKPPGAKHGKSPSAPGKGPASSPPTRPLPRGVVFVSGTGSLIEVCSIGRRGSVLVRHVGWRLPVGRLERGVTIGRSVEADLVAGTAALPDKAGELRLVGDRLSVTPARGASLSFTAASTAKGGGKGKSARSGKTVFRAAQGVEFGWRMKQTSSRPYWMAWRMTPEEGGHVDLLLTGAVGQGESHELAPDLSPGARPRRYLVGDHRAQFLSVLPDEVLVFDLETAVQPLVQRGILTYMAPRTLRAGLSARHSAEADLLRTINRIPPPRMKGVVGPLLRHRFLRARLRMANRLLARGRSARAADLFRIEGDQGRSSARSLRGMARGGVAIRAPRRNMLSSGRLAGRSRSNPRLRTVITARGPGSPFLQMVDREGRERRAPRVIYLPPPGGALDLAWSDNPPLALRKMALREVGAVVRPRTALWTAGTLFAGSQALFAEPPELVAERRRKLARKLKKTAAKAAPPPAPAARRFTWLVAKRWWSRKKGLQRSSNAWPLEELARKLAEPNSVEPVRRMIRRLNPRLVSKKKHCGPQSKWDSKASRWRHGTGCWGVAALVEKGAVLTLECVKQLVRGLREQSCRAGFRPTPATVRGKTSAPGSSSALAQAGASAGARLPGVCGAQVLVVGRPITGASAATGKCPRGGCVYVKTVPGTSQVRVNEVLVPAGSLHPLDNGDRLEVGGLLFRIRRPTGVLAFARMRMGQVVPLYPEGPAFSHAIAGAAGGPFRAVPRRLLESIPPAPGGRSSRSRARGQRRMVATTLDPDLQRIAYSVAAAHLARIDSAAFRLRFRRRYFLNRSRPHAGAAVVVNRRTGEVLAAVSLPAFDPNTREEKSGKLVRPAYLHGQITDVYGLTDDLLAYDPRHLPPAAPKAGEVTILDAQVPDLHQALGVARTELRKGVQRESRSGHLIERALRGYQTPGSTAKIVTAIAYQRWLEERGRGDATPVHQCFGGIMLKRRLRLRRNGRLVVRWRKSRTTFRCWRHGGHGRVDFTSAMAGSCNVYFAKLALEMAGVPRTALNGGAGSISWVRGRGPDRHKRFRYEMLEVEPDAIPNALSTDRTARMLFRTATRLGYSTRYGIRSRGGRRVYWDAYWEPGLPRWPKPDTARDPVRAVEQRRGRLLPHTTLSTGRFLGHGAGYPAWQHWVPGSRGPRWGLRVDSLLFGGPRGRTRAMAYLGFGQNLDTSPLRLALTTGVVASGGWLPAPRFWIGEARFLADGTITPRRDGAVLRPKALQALKAPQAQRILGALAAVATRGTAARPFANLNKVCLAQLGLRIVGKTGTAETRGAGYRRRLLTDVRAAGSAIRGVSQAAWLRSSGCRRRLWRYHYPEELVADSLFTAALVPTTVARTRGLKSKLGWSVEDLAVAVVVKNGYHPEGRQCLLRRKDQERAEAKYLAHDLLVAILNHLGACRDYVDRSSLLAPRLPRPKVTRRRRRRKLRRRPRRRRRKARKTGRLPRRGTRKPRRKRKRAKRRR